MNRQNMSNRVLRCSGHKLEQSIHETFVGFCLHRRSNRDPQPHKEFFALLVRDRGCGRNGKSSVHSSGSFLDRRRAGLKTGRGNTQQRENVLQHSKVQRPIVPEIVPLVLGQKEHNEDRGMGIKAFLGAPAEDEGLEI